MTDTTKKEPVKPARKRFCGVKGKSGPKPGSKNALRTGVGVDRRRLVVGELPKELICVRKEARAYRVALERAVMDARGEISVLDSHYIDTASGATAQAAIIRWCLRRRFATLSTTEILACSRELVKAKQARDLAVKALDLDSPPEPVDLRTYLTLDAEKGNGE